MKSPRVWLLVALLTSGANAQEVGSKDFTNRYVVTTWDTDAGSPFIAVTSMAQTPDGYLWLASYEGIARFDGIRFVHDAIAVAPFAGQLALSTVVDQQGDLWVGTSIGIWRRHDLVWEQYKPESGLLDGLIYSIACDSQGEIYALAGRKVVRWNGTAFEELPHPGISTTFSQHNCFFDEEDRFWVRGLRNLYYFQDGQWQTVRKVLPGNQSENLLGASPSRKGGIWVATAKDIQRLVNGESVEIKPRIPGHQNDEVSMWEDEAGNLWEAGEKNGLVIHQPDGQTLICTIEQGLSNNAILSIGPDSEGNIWLGSDGGGIARIRPRSLIAHSDRKQLRQPVINAIAEFDHESLLVGTHGGGVMPFQNANFGKALETEGNLGLGELSWVQAIEVTPNGVWLGSYQTGVFRINETESKQWTFRQLRGRHVYALQLDHQNRMWVGHEHGLTLIVDDQARNWEEEINWGVVNMIAEDSDDRIWVSNRDGDLWLKTDDLFEPVTELGRFQVGLVQYLKISEDNELWLTNRSNQILRQFGRGWIRYDESHGLPAGEWKFLASDNVGYHWFGSNRGLMRVTKESMNSIAQNGTGTLRCQILNRQDGMESARVRRGFQDIGVRARNGKIWVATIKGLVELDPANVRVPPQSPQIHIEQVRDGAVSLKATVLENDIIQIPAGTERVNIRYSGTSLSYADLLNFNYKLEGIDAEWVNAGSEPVARITDLKPGNYDFKVRVLSLEDRVVDEAKVTLIVEPFWWQRWGVQFSSVVLVILIVSAGISTAVRARYRRQNERHQQARILAEERLRTSQVQQEMEIANEANRAKSEFLATMSHEIRTPLNGVIGSMDLMRDTKLTREQSEHMSTLGSSAETLMAVLNDILDFSKIEAGKITLERAPFDLFQTLKEVVEVVGSRALEKGIELALVVPPELHLTVFGDAARLRQVLINLVGNSVKFTESGSITIRVETAKPAPFGNTSIRFRVQDTGVGIAPDRQAQLFEQFTQADASTTRKYGGTGLGLAICKSLVELMGGSIGVSSRLGQGAEFHFELPYPTSPASQAEKIPQPGPVVILDDAPTAMEAETLFLSHHGIQSQATSSFTEATDWIQQNAAKKGPPTWLLMDESCALKLSNDHSKSLRDSVEAGTARIILMSSRPNHLSTSLDFPFETVLRKPLLHTDSLRESFQNSPSKEKKTLLKETETDATAASNLENAEILLADDEPVNRLVLGKLLKRFGCKVDYAEHGADALKLAKRKKYAVILMDCRMPVMDGYEATSQILDTVKNAPPIIAITANTTVEDRERCTQVGMVDFISKPIRATELARVLREWV